jgi:hypothetical protein
LHFFPIFLESFNQFHLNVVVFNGCILHADNKPPHDHFYWQVEVGIDRKICVERGALEHLTLSNEQAIVKKPLKRCAMCYWVDRATNQVAVLYCANIRIGTAA